MAAHIKLNAENLRTIRSVDPRLVSYNVEMTEVTGGTFWKEYTPEKYIMTIDGQKQVIDAALITVGNSNQWGNNARITPLADISDGVLDVTVVDMFSTIEMPALGYLLMTGRLDRNSNVHCYRGKHIRITRKVSGPAHADGDCFNAGTELDIKVLPSTLKVIIP